MKKINAGNRESSRPRLAAFSRRRFLQTTAGVALAAPYFVPNSVLAAPGRLGVNDKPNIGIIGTGNRVAWLAGNWCDPNQMRLVALADCSTAKLEAFANTVKGRFPDVQSCARYEDYREMLDKEKLDGVFVTTPTHGRVLPCIHACQAGVDIYAEKPATLTIEEGQRLVRAVNTHNRVFQVGTQARSISVNCWAVEQLQRGAIGTIKKVLMPNAYGPIDYRSPGGGMAPSGMNWDMWCNQAPLVPYDPKLAGGLEDGWAPYRAYDGGGDRLGMTGFGTHAFDQVLWALGRATESPVKVRPLAPGKTLSPVILTFADGLEIELMDKPEEGPAFGGIFIGSEGKMEINRDRCATNPPEIANNMPKFDSPDEDGVNHVQNWIDCIRSRVATRCPVEVAHRQTVICHIINVARDLGREVRFDPATDRFVDDAEANLHPSVTRPRRPGYELPQSI